jgi:carbonic anhydrase
MNLALDEVLRKDRRMMRLFWIVLVMLAPAGLALAQDSVPLADRVLTQAEQQALSPDDVVKLLKDGNQRFVSGNTTRRDHVAQVRDAANGQHPMAIILSCVDSRVPVEEVFDLGIGDVFVARVAGNFENTDILGSAEFATKVSGAKLVLVMGHESCGAIKAAIDGAELGNITAMLKNIQPAIDAVSDYEGEKSGTNDVFVHKVAEKNVSLTMERVRQRSAILKGMEDQGDIKIVGAIYNMKTGAIEFLD